MSEAPVPIRRLSASVRWNCYRDSELGCFLPFCFVLFIAPSILFASGYFARSERIQAPRFKESLARILHSEREVTGRGDDKTIRYRVTLELADSGQRFQSYFSRMPPDLPGAPDDPRPVVYDPSTIGERYASLEWGTREDLVLSHGFWARFWTASSALFLVILGLLSIRSARARQSQLERGEILPAQVRSAPPAGDSRSEQPYILSWSPKEGFEHQIQFERASIHDPDRLTPGSETWLLISPQDEPTLLRNFGPDLTFDPETKVLRCEANLAPIFLLRFAQLLTIGTIIAMLGYKLGSR